MKTLLMALTATLVVAVPASGDQIDCTKSTSSAYCMASDGIVEIAGTDTADTI